jgi:TolB-like protein/class 3 adenylate cyclase/Tfp pilus assembly protein PilF
MPTQGRRQLAAIMFTDIVGYTHVMQEDETRGRLLRERHKKVFEQCTSRHEGRIVQYFGDGTLSVFDSAVSAVECAVCMQKNLKTYPQVPLRIGIHLGDIHYDDTEIYGHGVNVAARIEPVCNPGGVFISHKVYDEIQNHPWLSAKSLGVYRFKNIDQDIELYAVDGKDVTYPNAADIALVSERSQKYTVSESATQSKAIKRFIKEKKAERRSRVTKWAAIGLFALMGMVALAKFSFWNNPTPPNDGRISIAVLPFANFSPEQNDYFSDGMTEDILTKLSKIEGFSVTSRTSVMQYKDTEKSTRKIARELGVDHILEGSVSRDGDKVRITAQLIDGSNDSHLWANTYDAEFKNIFELQSQVATDIAHQLKIELSDQDLKVIEARPNYNVTAYDIYLKGREYYRKYTEADNDKAIELFKKALNNEPSYAYAYAGLGDAYAQKAFREDMNQELLDTAVLMSAKAVESDPELSEGYKALGLAFHYQGKFDEAITQYEKALELDPNNDMAANNLGIIARENGDIAGAAKWAHRTMEINKNVPRSAVNMAGLYLEVGDDERAEEIVDVGLAAHPEIPELQAMKGTLSMRNGDMGGAMTAADNVIRLMPEKPGGYDLLGNLNLYEGQWNEAVLNFEIALDKSVDRVDVIKYEVLTAYAEQKETGDQISEEYWEDILEQIDEIERSHAEHKGQNTQVIRAVVETAMGNFDGAMEDLRVAMDNNWIDYRSSMQHPVFEEMQNLPDFKNLMIEMKSRSDSLRREILIVTQDKEGS